MRRINLNIKYVNVGQFLPQFSTIQYYINNMLLLFKKKIRMCGLEKKQGQEPRTKDQGQIHKAKNQDKTSADKAKTQAKASSLNAKTQAKASKRCP